MKRGFCCVANRGCTAPAGYRAASGALFNGKDTVETTCLRCGDFVCRNCGTESAEGGMICESCRMEDER